MNEVQNSTSRHSPQHSLGCAAATILMDAASKRVFATWKHQARDGKEEREASHGTVRRRGRKHVPGVCHLEARPRGIRN